MRIWNVAGTQIDIQNLMNCEAQAQVEHLAYYKFNQGFNVSTNSSETAATDSSANVNTGTLNGFALTGGTSNWISGSPIVTGSTCATLEISNFDISSSFKIYPNPVKSTVNIDLSSVDNSSVDVYDIDGRKILTQKLSNSSNTINIDNLSSGMYLFKVTSDQGTATSKVVKN
jgi:hypothetical protein